MGMSQETPRLDDKFTNGVWYDSGSGDFCQIEETDDGSVRLINTLDGDAYYTTDMDEWVRIKDEFHRVPEEAVENPAEYLRDGVSRFIFNNVTSMPLKEERGMRYAYYHTNIVPDESNPNE